jgi:hypothetical protein
MIIGAVASLTQRGRYILSGDSFHPIGKRCYVATIVLI